MGEKDTNIWFSTILLSGSTFILSIFTTYEYDCANCIFKKKEENGTPKQEQVRYITPHLPFKQIDTHSHTYAHAYGVIWIACLEYSWTKST